MVKFTIIIYSYYIIIWPKREQQQNNRTTEKLMPRGPIGGGPWPILGLRPTILSYLTSLQKVIATSDWDELNFFYWNLHMYVCVCTGEWETTHVQCAEGPWRLLQEAVASWSGASGANIMARGAGERPPAKHVHPKLMRVTSTKHPTKNWQTCAGSCIQAWEEHGCSKKENDWES